MTVLIRNMFGEVLDKLTSFQDFHLGNNIDPTNLVTSLELLCIDVESLL